MTVDLVALSHRRVALILLEKYKIPELSVPLLGLPALSLLSELLNEMSRISDPLID